MSRVYEKRTVPAKPAHEVDSLVARACDLCGRKANGLATSLDEQAWVGRGDSEVQKTEIVLETGHSYPDGTSLERIVIDLCPDCFRQKLVPWVESQKGEPIHVEEVEF
jgi:hypothetical protein